MAESPQTRTPEELANEALDFWADMLERSSRAVEEARKRVDEGFEQPDPPAAFDELKGRLVLLSARATEIARAADDTRKRITTLRAEWVASRRWSDEGLAELATELRAHVKRDAMTGARRWLSELLDALDAQEADAVTKIAALELPWKAPLRAGSESIARAVGDWREGDPERGLELMSALAEKRGIKRWEDVPTPELRARAHRLAAWIALRRLPNSDEARARVHLDEAVRIYPYGGRMQAERAAYFLYVADFDMARTDAQHAIERADEGGNGYLELGIWAELTGEFDSADAFFDRGLKPMAMFKIDGLVTRASMIDPTGRLLFRAAKLMRKRRRPRSALTLADAALDAQVRGAEPHPHAGVQALRSRLVEDLGEDTREEAGALALAAGELYMWNGQFDLAIKQLTRAKRLDPTLEQAAWLRADILVTQSLPPGAVLPRPKPLELARMAWEDQYNEPDTGGPPAGESSWAYLTRAIIADLETQRDIDNREAGLWRAVEYVERALVHDDTDAQRWGLAAQYLRYAALNELALEAIERGRRLKRDDRRVLTERLVALSARGSVDAAGRVAEELIRKYGVDAQLSALRARIAIRRGRFGDALGYLELALDEGNDPIWYLDMRARCHIALDAPSLARADYREMLARERSGKAPAVSGLEKCRLAGGAAMIRATKKAGQWIERAYADGTAPEFARRSAAVWIILASGAADAAVASVEQAVAAAPSEAQIDSLTTELALRHRLLAGPDAELDRRVVEALAAARDSRLAHLVEDPPSADVELTRAMERLDNGGDRRRVALGRTALMAVAARRQAHHGDWEAAAGCYEKLLGRFDPEARIALTRAIRFASEEAAERGGVERVTELHSRLEQHGFDTPVDKALTLATALGADGRPQEAMRVVREQLEAADDPAERHALYRRLGRLALADGDLIAARDYLTSALAIVRSRGRSRSAGQLEVMLAAVGFREVDDDEVHRRLDAAVGSLRTRSVQDPEAVVVRDFLAVLATGDAGRERGEALDIARSWAEHVGRTDLVEQIEARRQGRFARGRMVTG